MEGLYLIPFTMSGKIVQLNEEVIKGQIKELVRGSVEEALMLVCARLRHVAGTQRGSKKYRNRNHLEEALKDVSIAS